MYILYSLTHGAGARIKRWFIVSPRDWLLWLDSTHELFILELRSGRHPDFTCMHVPRYICVMCTSAAENFSLDARYGSEFEPHHTFYCSFIRSFVLSFVRSFVRSFVHSIVHSIIRTFVRSFVCSFVRSIVRSCFRCSYWSLRMDAFVYVRKWSSASQNWATIHARLPRTSCRLYKWGEIGLGGARRSFDLFYFRCST